MKEIFQANSTPKIPPDEPTNGESNKGQQTAASMEKKATMQGSGDSVAPSSAGLVPSESIGTNPIEKPQDRASNDAPAGEEDDIAFAAEAAANAVEEADAEQQRLDQALLRCRICGQGMLEGRPVLRFMPVEHSLAASRAAPSVRTFTEDICLHIFCGKTASILSNVNRPELEILTKAGLKNKHGIGAEVNAALARTRLAVLVSLQDASPQSTSAPKEKQYYLVREFEAHLAAIRCTHIEFIDGSNKVKKGVPMVSIPPRVSTSGRPQLVPLPSNAPMLASSHVLTVKTQKATHVGAMPQRPVGTLQTAVPVRQQAMLRMGTPPVTLLTKGTTGPLSTKAYRPTGMPPVQSNLPPTASTFRPMAPVGTGVAANQQNGGKVTPIHANTGRIQKASSQTPELQKVPTNEGYQN